jgi:hypothetical protein
MKSFSQINYKVENLLDNIKEPLYRGSLFIIFFLYFVAFFGLYSYNQKYLYYLQLFMQAFVCIFLIVRFHPFRTHSLKPFDANIIFGSAVVLLTNLGVTTYMENYINNIIVNRHIQLPLY